MIMQGGFYTSLRSTLSRSLVFLPQILTTEWLLSHQLRYPQRPLFCNMISDCLGQPGNPVSHNRVMSKPEYFNGQNAIVAFNVHLGYNQEDSIVMNRASVQRGMFKSEHIRSYKAEAENKFPLGKRRNPDDCINFGKIQSRFGSVDSLDDDGFPRIGAYLLSGDIIIGRCSESGTDHSIKLRHTERGNVQKVVLSSNDEGKNFGVVCLRQGIVPDIVINPHAFPSRQAPGQLLEAALGKGIACGGSMRYATPFSTPSVDDITDQLHGAGFQRWGNERVYSGQTGQMVRQLIFMGPTFYQRLIHILGTLGQFTLSPGSQWQRFCGVKFGEMELDCLIAHGASANLHERLFTLCDSSQMHACQKCKNAANVIDGTVDGRRIRGPYCLVCKSADDIVRLNVPYGAKLLCQELFSMGISLKFETRLC